MSKGSNPTNVTTTTSAEPSEFIRPYFQQAIDYGQDLFESQTPQYFPEATYTGFAPQTETALQLAQARAIQGIRYLDQHKQKLIKFYKVIIYHQHQIHFYKMLHSK